MFASGQTEILVNYRVTKIIYAGFGAFSEQQWRVLLDALVK